MRPAPFLYEAPQRLDDAVALLADHGGRAAVLAGGQSLVPLLNRRDVRPAVLVDVNGISDLEHVRRCDGRLHLGALTRQAALERDGVVAEGWPLLRDTVRSVGHRATRSRGTVGGSVAHADAHAQLPVALTALDAGFHVHRAGAARTLTADELFVGHRKTALRPDELLVEITLPGVPPGARQAFAELRTTRGVFPTAGAAVVLAPGYAAVALLGADATPVRARAAEAALAEGASAAEAGAIAARVVDRPHRRALVAEAVRRAVEAAR